MRLVRFVTFGCKANQYDTQVLREALLRRGWEESGGPADLVVVNTCTVTAEAGRKARQLARRLARETPRARICITGCLAEEERESLRRLPGVEWVLPGREARRPRRFLEELGHAPDEADLSVPPGIDRFDGHTRAFLKIQDGCDLSCAFCIIPKVRGPSRSRPIEELRAETERLVASGHAEIVLCGIHIGHWGREHGGELADLVRALADLEARGPGGEPAPFRLRLSSIEATEVTDPLLERMAEREDRIAPHLHLPLQSGDDRVLERMRRWYTSAEYLAAIERIRDRLDDPGLSADVILGFPGEGEAEFEATARTVAAAGLSRLHVFPFSPRPGTAAAGLGPGAPPEVLRERKARLSRLAREAAAGLARRLDAREEVLVPEGWTGLSGRYQRVRLLPEEWPGRAPALARVRLEARGSARGPVELLGHPLPARRAASPGSALDG